MVVKFYNPLFLSEFTVSIKRDHPCFQIWFTLVRFLLLEVYNVLFCKHDVIVWMFFREIMKYKNRCCKGGVGGIIFPETRTDTKDRNPNSIHQWLVWIWDSLYENEMMKMGFQFSCLVFTLYFLPFTQFLGIRLIRKKVKWISEINL